MAGIVAKPEGVTYPPIDELLKHADSKYALALYAAKRARQINSYYKDRESNVIQYVGPVVPVDADDKPLSVALREIDEGKLSLGRADGTSEDAGDKQADSATGEPQNHQDHQDQG